MTPQEAAELATLRAEINAMREIVDKHEGFIDEARVNMAAVNLATARIEERLGAALKVQHLEGKIAGAIFTAILGIAGLIIAWFKK